MSVGAGVGAASLGGGEVEVPEPSVAPRSGLIMGALLEGALVSAQQGTLSHLPCTCGLMSRQATGRRGVLWGFLSLTRCTRQVKKTVRASLSSEAQKWRDAVGRVWSQIPPKGSTWAFYLYAGHSSKFYFLFRKKKKE